MTRLLNLAYFAMTDGLDKDKKAEVDDLLEDPPAGTDAHGLPAWARGDEELEMDMGDIAGLTGGPR